MSGLGEPNASTDRILDVLRSLRQKGVTLWAANGQLHYKGSKGVLTPGELECLRTSKGQIVALLDGAGGVAAAALRAQAGPASARTAPATLAFSQLAHWHLYRLGERRAMRQVTSATRLRGRLNVDALRRSLAEVIRRHDALRTRIVVVDGIPMQQVAEAGDCGFSVDDLTPLPEHDGELEVRRLVGQFVLEPIDLAADPLFGARLLKLRDDDHVLILALEHIISDAYSLNVLARDLFAAYVRAVGNEAFSWPTLPMQFADYAVSQRHSETSWAASHSAYWKGHLGGCRRLRFPQQGTHTANRMDRGTIHLRIANDVTAALREWCRVKRTTVALSIFTAYVGLLLRWCNASEGVILYYTDGRTSPMLETAIGYFAFPLYVRIELLDTDHFVALLKRVTEEWCNAYQHADLSYLAAQTPPPEFTRNPIFNWLPQGSLQLDFSPLAGTEDALTWSPVHFEYPAPRDFAVDREPFILLSDAQDEIAADVYFQLDRFSVDAMRRFGRNFLRFVEALVSQPDRPVKDIALVD
jgi:hypothetical protein